MKQTLRIQFDEQSKAVTASVDMTWDDIGADSFEGIKVISSVNDQQLAEAKRLFEEAQKYALTKTLQKNR
jgi:ribosomal protein L7/L12